MASSMRVALPISPGLARVTWLPSNTRLSMRASSSSSSLKPWSLKNLMPLSWKGLCEAEITTPASARIVRVRYAMPGVGRGPTNSTSAPTEQIPEASAVSSIYPERRVSLPTSTRRWRPPLRRKTWAKARPSRSAISDVIGYSLAMPRMPSVPNNRASRPASGNVLPANFLFLLPKQPQFDLLRSFPHHFHALGQIYHHRGFVPAAAEVLCVNIDRIVERQLIERAFRAAHRDRNRVRQDERLLRGVAHRNGDVVELALDNHLAQVNIGHDLGHRQLDQRAGVRQRHLARNIGGQIFHVHRHCIDRSHVAQKSRGSGDRHHRRLNLHRCDLQAVCHLPGGIQMDRQLLGDDLIDVQRNLRGRNPIDAGLAWNMEHVGSDFEISLARRDSAQVQMHCHTAGIE